MMSLAADYDDHFMTLRGDANIDLHFVHGVRTVTTRDGQAAAALADILVRGVSQTRIRRLASLCGESAPLTSLPEGWLGVLPTDAPLSTTGAWNRLLARLSASDWPDGVDHTQELRDAVTLLHQGTAEAAVRSRPVLQDHGRRSGVLNAPSRPPGPRACSPELG